MQNLVLTLKINFALHDIKVTLAYQYVRHSIVVSVLVMKTKKNERFPGSSPGCRNFFLPITINFAFFHFTSKNALWAANSFWDPLVRVFSTI